MLRSAAIVFPVTALVESLGSPRFSRKSLSVQ